MPDIFKKFITISVEIDSDGEKIHVKYENVENNVSASSGFLLSSEMDWDKIKQFIDTICIELFFIVFSKQKGVT